MKSPRARLRSTSIVPGFLLAMALSATSLHAQTGTVTGRVMVGQTGQPLPSARVMVVGTSIGALSDTDGRFRIENAPVGNRQIRVVRIGYQAAVTPVTVTDGGQITVELRMTETAIALDQIVVTGTAGDTRRKAIGNAVTSLNVGEILEKAPATTITEVLQSKTPGLTLLPGSGTAGTGANYRLRGASSIYGGNTPTFYVDGVRIRSSGLGNFNVFGQNTSALDAINPTDIESIEVIKGPAAATLYGAEAAGGVIQIITKKGRPGPLAWDARFEYGGNEWVPELRPINYGVATAARIADPVNYPAYQGRQVGDIITHRVMSEPNALRVGQITRFALGARGGGDGYSYYVSGGRGNEEGTYFNNFSNRTSLRGNFVFQPTQKLKLSTDIGYSISEVALPLSDNIATGLIISSYLATPGRAYPYPAGLNYFTIEPGVFNTYENITRSDRFILGATAEYRLTDWFVNKLTVGYDLNAGQAEVYFAPARPGTNPFTARASFDYDNTKGLIAEGRPLYKNLTLDWSALLTRALNADMVSNFSVGMQYLRNNTQLTETFGQDLGAAGIRSISSAAVTWGDENFTEQMSFGIFAQEQVGWRDRLFVTGAVRMDNNSAFGSELNRVFYPKLSASWVITEEDFFNLSWVEQLRLRAAWGQAGNSPGPFDAVRSYTTSVATGPTSTSSALRYSSVGNPNLKPERSSEIEVGFETDLFAGRLGVDLSYYNSRTKDALLPVAVAPSTGFAGNQLQNLGTISNSGIELLLTAVPLRIPFLSLKSTIALSTNRNELVSFGDDRAPIAFGAYAPVHRYQEGYPLAGFWAQQVRYDANGALVKDALGRPILQDTSIYRGPSTPTREISLSNTITLFDQVRLYGLIDYKAGHWQFNVKDWRRDRSGVSWETVNPAADPDEVLARQFASQTYIHVQRADFVKLRDLGVSYDLPGSMIRRIGLRSATLTLAGHNLKIWTKYNGADPEVSFHGDEAFNRNDSWTVPQTRRLSSSLAVGF